MEFEPAWFTSLTDGATVDDDALAALYSYPPAAGRPVVRANAIISLDGSAVTGGTSGGLGGRGDRLLFAVLRELADVIVVGAGTARAETYSGARMTVAARQRRQRRGQSEVPPIALVTRTGDLDRDLAVLTDTEVAPLVLTCSAAAATARARLGGAAQVLDCSAGDPGSVDLATALTRLADRGLMRVLTEGGPSLLGSFAAAGLLDELCLTTAPLIVGGDGGRITAGGREVTARLRRAHLLGDGEGYLYARYTRER